jgi:adenylylsulfate kinase
MGVAPKGTNLTWHGSEIDRATREESRGHKGATLWLTGLSGSGKSTLAHRVERRLLERSVFAYVLDGDNVRHGLNRDLGFSAEDRQENIRRLGEVAKLFTDAGAIVLTAFISPYRADRQRVRDLLAPGDFVEVYVAASIEVCESRDPKGLYAKARRGEIPDFTGISAPYEAPENAVVTVDTGELSLDESADRVVRCLESRGILGTKG